MSHSTSTEWKSLSELYPALDREKWESLLNDSLKGRAASSLESELFPGFKIEAIHFHGEEKTGSSADSWITQAGSRPRQVLQASSQAGLESGLKELAEIGQSQVVLDLGCWLGGGQALDTALSLLKADGRDWLLEWPTADAATLEACRKAGCLEKLEQDAWSPALLAGSLDVAAVDPSRPQRLSAHLLQEAGADAATELAGWLALFACRLRELEAAGFDPAGACLRHELALDSDLFPELAKLRAARLLAARLITASGLGDGYIQLCGRSSRRSFTALDPWNNLLRTSLQALAAHAAGLEGLQLLEPKALLGPASEMERRVTWNQHLILAGEGWLDAVRDPGAGSLHLENLTLRLAEAAWQRFQQIEAVGGLAVVKGRQLLEEMIVTHRNWLNQQFATRRRVLVGVGNYADGRARLEGPSLPGEISEAGLGLFRTAAVLENLRIRAGKLKDRLGQRARILLLPAGAYAKAKPRLDFARGFLAVAGLDLVECEASDHPQEALSALSKEPAAAIVLCGPDELLDEWLLQLSTMEALPPTYVAAPAVSRSVAGLLHRKADQPEIIKGLLEQMEAGQ
jgi:hypothetical protein